MEKSDKIVLTPGSKYRIKSMEHKDKPMLTHGKFKGYTSLGHDDAVCLELDDSHKELAGKIRIIPCSMIMVIDVVEAAEAEKKELPEGMYI
jgi:hypothetical protein